MLMNMLFLVSLRLAALCCDPIHPKKPWVVHQAWRISRMIKSAHDILRYLVLGVYPPVHTLGKIIAVLCIMSSVFFLSDMFKLHRGG